MRRSSLFVLLAALSLSACAHLKTQPDLDRFLVDANRITVRRGIARLEACAEQCAAPARSAAAEMLRGWRMLVAIDEATGQDQEQLEHQKRETEFALLLIGNGLREYLRDAPDLHSKTIAARSLLAHATLIGLSQPEIRDQLFSEIKMQAERAAQQFPSAPDTYLLLALALSAEKADNLKIIKASAECLRLDIQHAGCREIYLEHITLFRHPLCMTDGIRPGLQLTPASEAPSDEFTIPVQVDGHTLFRPEGTGLLRTDLLSIGKKALPDGESSIEMQMTPLGSLKLAAITSRHAGRRLLLLVDARAITDPVIPGPVEDGRFSLRQAAEQRSIFSDLCAKTTVPRLPEELVVRF